MATRVKLALLATCFPLLFGSCGDHDSRMSALQRYDLLKPQLRWMTSQSSRVAHDTSRLANGMRTANQPGIRAAAIPLKVDAWAFSGAAARLRDQVRKLAGAAPSPITRAYLNAIATALALQAVEGRALIRLAVLVWADPLAVAGRDAEQLQRDVSWAQGAAASASRWTRFAAYLRTHHRTAFRYSPAPSKRRHP